MLHFVHFVIFLCSRHSDKVQYSQKYYAKTKRSKLLSIYFQNIELVDTHNPLRYLGG